MPRRAQDAIVLAAATATSVGYFGWRLFPHPGRYTVGGGPDTGIYIWGFGWWEHALATLSNPFVSHALYAPTGVNLTWTPSAPGIALLFAPLTALVGPVVSCNAATLLAPALSAFTAYLLCRALTGSVWASVVGGYLFGFSSPMLRQELGGHLNLTAVFCFPLVALATVRFVRGEIGGRGLAWRRGGRLAAQIWISTEFALTTSIMFVAAFALALVLLRDARPRLRRAVAPVLGACGIGAVLAAPFLVYLVLGYRPATSLLDQVKYWGAAGTDLLQFVVPNGVHALGGSSFPSVSAIEPTGDSSYLGLPTLAVVALFAVRWRRAQGTRFLVACLLLAALTALGSTLQVDGHKLLTLPWWNLATHLPAVGDALPFRFAVYTSLAAAVVVALWTARTRGAVFPRPYVLPVLAVAFLVPSVWRSTYPTFWPERPAPLPAFFASGVYRRCLAPGETVVGFPWTGRWTTWQAETGFRFRLAMNGMQPFPKYGRTLNAFDDDQVVHDLTFSDVGEPTMPRLLAFAAIHRVGRVLALPGLDYPTKAQLARFGPVERIGGLLVAPACGRPPLAARELAPYVAAYRRETAKPRGQVGYCLGGNFDLLDAGLLPAGVLEGARRAIFVLGEGITCPPAPAGYVRRGFAPASLDVTPGTYPLYVPARR